MATTTNKQLTWKKRRCKPKEEVENKKIKKQNKTKNKTPDKKYVIVVGEFDDEEDGMTKIEWKYFEVRYLNTIWGEMEKRFASKTNKQRINFKTWVISFFTKMNVVNEVL